MKLIASRFFLPLAFAVSVLASSKLGAQDINVPPADEKPAYTLDDAQDFLKEVLPFTEKAVGKKLKIVPKIIIIDSEGMFPVLRDEMRPQIKNLYPGYSDEQIDSLSTSQAKMNAGALLGKYGLDGKLYLLPDNLPQIFKVMNIDEKYTIPILKLLIANELTHALQDQETDLKRVWKITESDELNAFTSVIEGQAIFAEDLVGKAMGVEDSAIEISRLFSTGSLHKNDSAEDMVAQIKRAQYEQIYVGGRKFIEYYYQKGGNPLVWEIIAKPPLKTSMISKPETYSSDRTHEKNFAALFDGLDKNLGGGIWHAQNSALGEMVIRSAYIKIDEKNREEIISNISRLQVYSAQNENIPGRVVISAIVLRQSGFAKKYIGILEDQVQKNIQEIQLNPAVGIENFALVDFPGIKADVSRKMSFTVKMKSYDGDIRQKFYRIARGSLMIEFFFDQFDIKDESVIAIAEKVFTAYEGLKK